MISFLCPNCLKGYEVPDDKAGQTATCPACQSEMTVPSPGLDLDATTSYEEAPSKTATYEPKPTTRRRRDETPRTKVARPQLSFRAVVVAATVMVVVVAALAYWLWPDGNRLTPDNWLRIHPGMSAGDVRIILGEPKLTRRLAPVPQEADYYSRDYPGCDYWSYWRDWRGRTVGASVFVKNGVVVGKDCDSHFTN